METTAAFLDALRARYELSDRKAARLLGVSQTAVSNWRTGRDFPNDTQCRKLAELLDLDEHYVMARVHQERAREPAVKASWKHLAERIAGAAAAVLLGIGLAGAPAPARAAFNINPVCAPPEYTYSHFRRRRRPGGPGLAKRALAGLSAMARYARDSLPLAAF